MNPDRPREILQALADGIDPYTGEQFPPDSPYQRADTVRALYAALQALTSPADAASSPAGKAAAPKPVDPNKPRAGVPRRSDLPKAGGPWTPEEEQRLREAFAAKKPFDAIAAEHGRSRGAITTRLVNLGLITLDDQLRSDRPPPPALRPEPIQPPATNPPAPSKPNPSRPTRPPIDFDPEDCPF